ncbi:hypothetical protein [Streptomyces sp. NPDC055055]
MLGEFRRTAVLVPFDEQDSLWTADFNGVPEGIIISSTRKAGEHGDAARQ